MKWLSKSDNKLMAKLVPEAMFFPENIFSLDFKYYFLESF